MKITLLSVGKIDNPYYAELARDYQERLSRYVNFSWQVVKPESGKGLSPEEIVARESSRLLLKLSLADYTVVLDKTGRELSSEELAAFLRARELDAKSTVFIIGGPWGLSRELTARSNLCLSLSKMTLPHEMAAVVLLEQLYRAYTIIRNEGYHKKDVTPAAAAHSAKTPLSGKK